MTVFSVTEITLGVNKRRTAATFTGYRCPIHLVMALTLTVGYNFGFWNEKTATAFTGYCRFRLYLSTKISASASCSTDVHHHLLCPLMYITLGNKAIWQENSRHLPRHLLLLNNPIKNYWHALQARCCAVVNSNETNLLWKKQKSYVKWLRLYTV